MKKLLSLFIALILMHPYINIEAVAAQDPTLYVDMTNESHDIIHGSAGFLYGISNEGVPDVNTLTPLKPKVLATKGALGTEHPYGDALDVADEFFESGGEQVQMYNSNYYGVFGVTANAYDYGKVLKDTIAPHVADWKNSMRSKYPDIDQRMVYIPINEGTPVNGVSSFNEAWKIYYESIKESDPKAFIAGPNDAVYRGHNSMLNFLSFCKENNCLPDIISWHELQVGCLDTMDDHIADYRNICRTLNIEEKQIVINEYADYSDCGVPGRLVNWIARLEYNRVYGCLPFWHQANNLNDLAANSNDGNGAWWVYKWYGDMSGQVLNISAQNTTYDRFYGLASIDEAKQSATIICGGNDGDGIVKLSNMDKTSIFKNESYVKIKVEESLFTGYHGVSGEPQPSMEAVLPIVDGNVEIKLPDMLFSTAYRISITKTDNSNAYVAYSGYHKCYEAENAVQYGTLTEEKESSPIESPRYFCSGRMRIGGIDQEGEGICYNIDIPYDGLYKLQFLYGNGVGSARNNASSHAPKNISQKLIIDGNEELIMLPSTLFYSMEGMVEKYVSLSRGNHTVSLMYSSDAGAFHDCMYVSYQGAYNTEPPAFDKIYEAEDFDFNPESLCMTESEKSGFSGRGYISGLDLTSVAHKGGIRQTVHVPHSGLYSVSFSLAADADGSLDIYLDNTNLTFTNHITSIPVSSSGTWSGCHTTIFLRQGLNIIDISSDIPLLLDYMRVTESEYNESIVYEAEDASGNAEVASKDNVSYVLPMKGSSDARENNYIEFTASTHEEGLHKMQIFQSNDELCGTHSYNIKIIDRYATIEVNGDKANSKRYFFPNTFSEDTFLERTIPIHLEKGENTIRIYNDDSWQVLWGGSTSEPGTNELANYTPNFDKFIITPAVVDAPAPLDSFKISASSTSEGYIYTDKTSGSKGENVTVYVIPEGETASLLINGEEMLDTLQTDDGEVYYTTFQLNDHTNVYAVFSPSLSSGTPIPDEAVGNITIDGKAYIKTGENLFKNGDFSDPSGENMSQWFTGVNVSGHPSDALYDKPVINSDGTYENLIPLTESGLLTTGGYEIDNADTFYFGRDNSSTYLVEHMAFDWQDCAWNGSKSLLAFIPIKENTAYTFSFRAYTVNGKASIRYGAIQMENYIPASYSPQGSLNFTSSDYFDCTNGDVQNVGGGWTDYTLSFTSGDGADYFLFNAYWLQMAEYLCIGGFELYELVPGSAVIIDVSNPSAMIIPTGEAAELYEFLTVPDENQNTVTVNVSWLDPLPDVNTPGVYSLTGKLTAPEGYRLKTSYITQKIVITDYHCEIYSWEKQGNSLKLFVKGYKDSSATLFVAEYAGDAQNNIRAIPIDLKKGELSEIVTNVSSPCVVFIWSKENVTPLCAPKKNQLNKGPTKQIVFVGPLFYH